MSEAYSEEVMDLNKKPNISDSLGRMHPEWMKNWVMAYDEEPRIIKD